MKITTQMLLSGFLNIFIAAPIGWYSLVLFHMSSGVYMPSMTQLYGLFFSMLIGLLFWIRNVFTFSDKRRTI